MKKVRISRPSLSVLILIILAVVASARPVSLFAAGFMLKSALHASSARVGSIGLRAQGQIALSDISVKHPAYEVTVKNVSVSCPPQLLFRGVVSRIIVENAVVNVVLPRGDLTALAFNAPVSGQKKGFLRVQDIEIKRAQVKVNSPACKAQALVNAKVNAMTGLVDRLEASVDSFEYAGIVVKGLSLSLVQGAPTGLLYCGSLAYGKIALKDLGSPVSFNRTTISFDKIKGNALRGELIGRADVTLEAPFSYHCSLRMRGLEFSELVKQLEIEEKFTATGTLEGTFVMEGAGARVGNVDGAFHSILPGVLRIKDQRIIQNIAGAIPKDIPPDLFMETLKNYKYNKGTLDIGLIEEGLTAGLVFEAQAGGKIEFTVVLHPPVREK